MAGASELGRKVAARSAHGTQFTLRRGDIDLARPVQFERLRERTLKPSPVADLLARQACVPGHGPGGLHIPVALANINERCSRHRINISAQYLQTNEHLGYCVMDVDTAASELAIDELQSVPGTIRARLLY